MSPYLLKDRKANNAFGEFPTNFLRGNFIYLKKRQLLT